MLRTFILIFEAVILASMLYLANQLLKGEQTGTLLTILSVLLPATEYFRRIQPNKVIKETKVMDAGEKIRHAEELRQKFDKEIMLCRAEELRKDAIIRHVSRKDEYPNVSKKRKGISSWFKVGLEETYHSGIHVGLSFHSLKICPDGYRLVDYKKDEKGDVKVMLMGAIPFDNIETVNIEGDEYYSFPHIFCHFPFNTEPYERLFYAEVTMQPHGHSWYKEITDYESVKVNSELHYN